MLFIICQHNFLNSCIIRFGFDMKRIIRFGFDMKLTAMKEKLSVAEKARDDALKETLLWQGELAKAREHAVIMEAALARAEETARQASAVTTVKAKNCVD